MPFIKSFPKAVDLLDYNLNKQRIIFFWSQFIVVVVMLLWKSFTFCEIVGLL